MLGKSQSFTGKGFKTESVAARKSTKKGILTKMKKGHTKNLFHFPIGFKIDSAMANDRVSVKRDYGYMHSKGASTPYPQKTPSIDEMSLAAKLESDSLLVSGTSSTSFCTSPLKSVTLLSNGLTFQMRRKLFDEGEFTVCKGRKMSDVYHRTDEDLEDLSVPNQRIDTRNKPYSNYKDVKEYCAVNNIELTQGFGG
ncbi:uncharacterized protein LOC119562519 [Drosophila subpulchrella]|uniref:uncharacterized protein LOC119562519 n=1 Tax=Drosophila subpulchrella TaxID=1486046 RepID=UPI0018A13D2C|nr:uncharacterized protein LOC119562519 [Drosophila subpulchrella]